MPYTKSIVFTFGTTRKAGDPLRFAQGLHAVTAAGENLVRISLVANIPYQLVIRGVEHIMQCDGQFYHA